MCNGWQCHNDDIDDIGNCQFGNVNGEPVVAQGTEWSTAGNSEPSQAGQVLYDKVMIGWSSYDNMMILIWWSSFDIWVIVNYIRLAKRWVKWVKDRSESTKSERNTEPFLTGQVLSKQIQNGFNSNQITKKTIHLRGDTQKKKRD